MNKKEITCPDCGQTSVKMHLAHERTCPVSKSIDAMTDTDKAWFIAHPHASRYWRDLVPGDLGLHTLDGVQWEGKVLVKQISPGVRTRMLPPFTVRPDADSLSIHTLREMLRQTPVLPEEQARRFVLIGDIDGKE